jgi:hypothetical protein
MAVNFQNTKADYSEAQVSLLCGKHAINNILQEEKLVWEKDKPLLIDRKTKESATVFTSPMFSQTQLNLHKFCELYPARVAQASQQSLENAQATMTKTDLCDMANGNVPLEGLNFILRDLQFRTERESIPDGATIKDALIEKMTKNDNLLGVIFNLGRGHYTALSKFLKKCKSWTRNATRRLTSVSYSYIDSIPNTIECKSKADLGPFLKGLKISAVLYIYWNPASYSSVSVRRAKELAKAAPLLPAPVEKSGTKGGSYRKRNTRKYRRTH